MIHVYFSFFLVKHIMRNIVKKQSQLSVDASIRPTSHIEAFSQ